MPKYYDEGEAEQPRSACAGVREDLKACLLKSDCVRKGGKTPRECLEKENMPEECAGLKAAFFECKRSLLDMRQRFRGRKGY